jgi:hypothetical protein
MYILYICARSSVHVLIRIKIEAVQRDSLLCNHLPQGGVLNIVPSSMALSVSCFGLTVSQ